MRLFHYTCRHGLRGITRRGFLRPNAQPVLAGIPLVWLTDQDVPNREGLGLTSNILDCDRLEYRYIVEATNVQPWLEMIRTYPLVSAEALTALHGDGRQPEHWFVSTRALWAELDRSYSLRRSDEAHAAAGSKT